ncbi:MAG: ATP-binding protein [Lentisphaerae bacterium]|nr:ATP-binding protein [Lentisphaerota bacterium]
MLPFKSGMHVLGRDFCGRKRELKLLREYMVSAARVYLVGERRIGKSSLILEAIRRQKGYRPLYVDFLAIKTVDDLCKRIVKALITMEHTESYVVRMLKQFSALRPTVSLDPLTSLPSVGLAPSVKLQPESIESILDVVGSLKRTVVVFDEFQDILKLKDRDTALALMRSGIQQHANTCYCFAGSVRSHMDDIFTLESSPFFKSALPLQVGPLDPTTFGNFIRKKFETGRRSVGDEILRSIMQIGCSNPGDIQRLCVALWQISSEGDALTHDHVAPALQFIFTMENRAYEDIIEQITGQQMACLRALAAKGGASTLSVELVSGTGIALVTSIRKAMNRLVEKRILFREATTYRFCDPFFRTWIMSNNL